MSPGSTLPAAGPAQALGLLLALGIGLLVGLERERRKGRGTARAAAGVRSFALASVAGALAQWIPVPGLVLAGAVFVALLAAISHHRSRSPDPGTTTELALFCIYLIGVLAVAVPWLAASSGVALALLLEARTRLHRFATELLTAQELHDALVLCALALIVLPLVPDRPLAWLGAINPRPLAMVAVLIVAVQALSHVAVRWLGPRFGPMAAGFLAGFASSTATVALLGRRARQHPDHAAALAAAAGWSCTATWLLAFLMTGTISTAAAVALWPTALAGLAGTLIACLGLSGRVRGATGESARPLAQQPAVRLREALGLSLMLAAIAAAASLVQRGFGHAGLMWGVALAGLADAHASVASLATLFAQGRMAGGDLALGVLLSIAASSATRFFVAWATGGWGHAWRVGAVLVSGLLGAGWVARS